MDRLSIDVIPGGDGIRILRLDGPLTLRALVEFQSILRDGEEPITIVNLAKVPFVDSAGLGALIGVHTSSQKLGRKYAVVGASDRVRTLFEVAGIEKILVTYDTVEDAKKALAAV
ncbi:MAG TPA: STAS domain-containing protein [Bryobacteraceae bacterium]